MGWNGMWGSKEAEAEAETETERIGAKGAEREERAQDGVRGMQGRELRSLGTAWLHPPARLFCQLRASLATFFQHAP